MQYPARARQFQVLCLLLGILWVGHAARTAQAQQGETTDTHVYDFGLHLFRLGDYYRAITEFKRFRYSFRSMSANPPQNFLLV